MAAVTFVCGGVLLSDSTVKYADDLYQWCFIYLFIFCLANCEVWGLLVIHGKLASLKIFVNLQPFIYCYVFWNGRSHPSYWMWQTRTI